MVHGLMDKITRTKTNHITITKNKESVIFSVQSIIAKLSHPVIAAILDVILSILQG